jgi:hypothetical protein
MLLLLNPLALADVFEPQERKEKSGGHKEVHRSSGEAESAAGEQMALGCDL